MNSCIAWLTLLQNCHFVCWTISSSVWRNIFGDAVCLPLKSAKICLAFLWRIETSNTVQNVRSLLSVEMSWRGTYLFCYHFRILLGTGIPCGLAQKFIGRFHPNTPIEVDKELILVTKRPSLTHIRLDSIPRISERTVSAMESCLRIWPSDWRVLYGHVWYQVCDA